MVRGNITVLSRQMDEKNIISGRKIRFIAGGIESEGTHRTRSKRHANQSPE